MPDGSGKTGTTCWSQNAGHEEERAGLLENRIRPIALGRSNWLFAGSARAGRRAAVVMSLIQSAKLNGRKRHF